MILPSIEPLDAIVELVEEPRRRGTSDNGQFSSIRAAFRVVGRALERTFRVFEATRDHLQARSKRFG